MAFVVLYDACVLYPAPLRDLLVRIANTGIVRARWTELILDECFRNILEQRPDLKPEALRRTRELMTQAVPDCLVTGFETLIAGLSLPDKDDRHVLAAAVRAGAVRTVVFGIPARRRVGRLIRQAAAGRTEACEHGDEMFARSAHRKLPLIVAHTE